MKITIYLRIQTDIYGDKQQNLKMPFHDYLCCVNMLIAQMGEIKVHNLSYIFAST